MSPSILVVAWNKASSSSGLVIGLLVTFLIEDVRLGGMTLLLLLGCATGRVIKGYRKPKKDKTDQQANGSISPSGDSPALPPPDATSNKPERPSSLGPGKLTRRLLCYHSEHCMSHSSPPRPSALTNTQGEGQSVGTPPPTERQPHPSTLTLSELPEPPIPVSEIGPIPPPPMFSSPSPTMLLRQGQPISQGQGLHNAVPLDLSDFIYEERAAVV
uniref:Uncharacterized protein n=1 Tax=Timema monikensis TaxID=170555 RepID=A0A7R9E0W8_9NEOP|nr:unnamed protein product [Timema monikensis]